MMIIIIVITIDSILFLLLLLVPDDFDCFSKISLHLQFGCSDNILQIAKLALTTFTSLSASTLVIYWSRSFSHLSIHPSINQYIHGYIHQLLIKKLTQDFGVNSNEVLYRNRLDEKVIFLLMK